MNKWKLFGILGLILLVIGGMGLFFRQDEVVENIESIEFKLDNSNRKQTNFILIDKDVGKFNVVIDTTGLSLDMICTITVNSSNKNLKFYTDKNYSNELSEYNYIQNNEKKTITIYYRGNNITDEQVSINVENEVKHKNEIQTEIESIEFELDDNDKKQTKSIVIDKNRGKFNVVIKRTDLTFDTDCTITIDSSDKNLKFYTDKKYKSKLSEYNFTQNNGEQTITIYYRGDNKTSNVQVNVNVENKNKNEIIRDAKMMEQKENFAFWTKEYRKNIKHIIFEKGISNVPKDCTEKNKCFDISSSASKNKVYAYIIDNDLYITSEYEIHAPSNSSYMFKDFETVESIDFSNLNTMDATSMSYMFSRCSSLTSLDLNSFNTSNVKSMDGMFLWCSSLTNLDLSDFNTSNVENMKEMFRGCSRLASLDLNNFNTQKTTNMDSMFSWCPSLTTLSLKSFNTSNVTNMNNMFNLCWNLTSLDLSNFNTSKVTDMSRMFAFCEKLVTLNLSNFDTSNVKNMNVMFYSCSSLTSLDLNSFNTSKVSDMSSMFANCEKLVGLNLSNFDTSNVTNMSDMFTFCEKLVTLNLSNFNISNVNNIETMFRYCSSLVNLDLSSFNTSKVTDLGGMFENCSSLTSLDLSNFDTSNVIDMNSMFNKCEKLTNLKINFNMGKVKNIWGMFYGCERIITQINITNDNIEDADSVFKNAATYEGSSIILGYTDETYETVIKMKGNNERIILKKIGTVEKSNY